MKEIQRSRIELTGNPVNTEYTLIYFTYSYIPQSKKGEEGKILL